MEYFCLNISISLKIFQKRVPKYIDFIQREYFNESVKLAQLEIVESVLSNHQHVHLMAAFKIMIG